MNTEQALKLKGLIIAISPLIEEYTALICPSCRDVCCKQKRAFLDPVDARYITALGLDLPVCDSSRDPEGSCQFMGPTGCVTPRWLRPWRCTWYFCDPLLDAMKNGPQKKARTLSALIQEVVDIRSEIQE